MQAKRHISNPSTSLHGGWHGTNPHHHSFFYPPWKTSSGFSKFTFLPYGPCPPIISLQKSITFITENITMSCWGPYTSTGTTPLLSSSSSPEAHPRIFSLCIPSSPDLTLQHCLSRPQQKCWPFCGFLILTPVVPPSGYRYLSHYSCISFTYPYQNYLLAFISLSVNISLSQGECETHKTMGFILIIISKALKMPS